MRLLILLLIAVLPAQAQTAESWYRDGRWDTASDAALAGDSALLCGLGLRAGLVHAGYRLTEDQHLDALRDLASKAEHCRARFPDYPEILLQSAAITGYLAGFERSLAKVRQSRAFAEQALALDRNNVWAWAAIGSWHGEVRIKAGWIGRIFFGAKKSTALESYEKAMALDPDNIPVRFNLARLLFHLAGNEGEDRAAKAFGDLAALEPRNAFDRLLQSQARELSALAAQGALTGRSIEAMLPFKGDPVEESIAAAAK